MIMVSISLLGALLLDYYGKTMLWSWCVYVSTGGSTTGLLWEDCVVVMLSMCLLRALLLDYYRKTMF